MWRKSYPYLKNSSFLKLVDTQHLQNHYVKITLLDWKENPIEEIQGKATEGSISVNGNSSVRRTCTLTMMATSLEEVAISNVKNLISIGRKIFLEIGISNNTGEYEDEYPIIWYPQGYFVFSQCTITSGLNNGITISAQLKDKMCLLNGECGGIIPSTVQFDVKDTLNADGEWITEKVTIAQIIREAVNHWGGEQLGRILISDIDEKVKMVVRWIGDNPVYLINQGGNYFFSMDKQSGGIQTFNYGDDIGFEYTDFTYPGELIANPGDNICTAVLDKIKSVLGNYEYFYDVYGNFVFQEIKDYKNTTQATVEINNMTNEDYEIDISKGKSVYDFKDNELAISFSNTPQYSRIKNDFVIWGVRKDVNNIKIPIRYHLAIDKKPKIGDIFNVYFYTDPEDGLRKAKIPLNYPSKSAFPTKGNLDVFYLDESTGITYKWDSAEEAYVSPSGYRSIEYTDINDFPENPDPNIIYIDKSTNKAYMWQAQSGTHYDDVQAEIDALTNEYNQAVAAIQVEIGTYEEQLEDITNQISALNTRFESELVQLERYTQDYNNVSDSIDYSEDKIESNNALIAQLEGTITYLNNRYTDLINQARRETDPVKQAELNNQAAAVLAQRQGVEVQRNSVVQQNDELVESIDNLETTQSFDKNIIGELENKLTVAGYYSDLTGLEGAYNTIQTSIEDLQADLAKLEVQYHANLIDLLYKQKQYVEVVDDIIVKVQTTDWRSQLYLQGAAAEALGLESNYYYPELNAEWPKIYNLTAHSYINSQGQTIYTGDFLDGVLDNPWDLDYWLDFIDSETAIGGLSVSNIGRRSFSENKDDYNCLFEPEIQDFILIETGQEDTDDKRDECDKRNQKYIQISPEIYNQTAIGGLKNSCFERIKEVLYDYTAYNNSISITCMPIYHLETNTRITVASQENDIYGDHLIGSISIPLTVSGTMTIAATKCNAKL